MRVEEIESGRSVKVESESGRSSCRSCARAAPVLVPLPLAAAALAVDALANSCAFDA